MNKVKEEFGEKRLISSVAANPGIHAKEILNNILKEVQQFIGIADQHDDMTMVVVKVD
jgi:sigma-B regulation protein RsbU (phosphoserine phosphatase)